MAPFSKDAVPPSTLQRSPDDPSPDEKNSATSPSVPLPSFPCRRPVRVTLYTLLGAFALLTIAWGILPGIMDPTFEQHIQNKEVIAGMTREQALEAWGSPYQMNVTYTDRGVRREEWVYEDWIDAGSVRHRYLYFEEGVLVGGWYYQ